jgi:hypothetical protein
MRQLATGGDRILLWRVDGAAAGLQRGGAGLRGVVSRCVAGADRGPGAADEGDAVNKALEAGKADWEMDYYSGAKHSFTVEGVDKKGIDGMAYDKEADERSWARMLALFDEKFE